MRRHLFLCSLFTGLAGLAGVCSSVNAQKIYTCIDEKGRTLTADRPIPECIARVQRELSHSGFVKRQMGPTLTPHEEAAQEEKDKRVAEVRARENEAKRRDRALLQRYPARPAHDQERGAALLQVDEVIQASDKRKGELLDQRKSVANEFEFYAKDPSRAPASLKRQRDENEASLLVQQKFAAEQEQEKKRIHQRFDEELARLKQLWAMVAAPSSPVPSVAKVGKN